MYKTLHLHSKDVSFLIPLEHIAFIVQLDKDNISLRFKYMGDSTGLPLQLSPEHQQQITTAFKDFHHTAPTTRQNTIGKTLPILIEDE